MGGGIDTVIKVCTMTWGLGFRGGVCEVGNKGG